MIQLIAFVILVLALVVILKGSQLLLKRDTHPAYMRAAYAISGFWLVVPFLLMLATHRFQIAEIDEQAWVAWILLAVVPNASFWVFLWVMRGFQEQK